MENRVSTQAVRHKLPVCAVFASETLALQDFPEVAFPCPDL